MKLKKPARVNTALDTADSESLTDRASKVGEVAPSSAIYANPSVKNAIDAFVADGLLLSGAEAQVLKDDATAAKSRAVRDALLLTASGTYGIAATTVEKYALSPADLITLGFEPAIRASYAMASPLDLLVSFDPVRDLIDILVKHAPGMRACHVELSADPIGVATWKRLDGIAAEYHLAGYAPGTWWVRAQSVRGTTVSDWLGPVAVIVR